jgi:hypothetical protein
MDREPLALAPRRRTRRAATCWPTSTFVAEVGASYPLPGYVLAPDEPYEEETALDPVIDAALLRP